MKKRKMICLLATFAMLLSILAACGNGNGGAPAVEPADDGATVAEEPADDEATPTEEPADDVGGDADEATEAEILHCNWVLPGSAPPDVARVLEAINQQMAADGVNVHLDMTFIAWDVWEQRINVMFATGEEVDIINTMENWWPSTTWLMGMNALAPINEYLDRYGSNLKAGISQAAWDQATQRDGTIYTIPAEWIESGNSDSHGWLNVRQDLYDYYGLSIPTSVDEIIETSRRLQAAIYEDTGEIWYIYPEQLGKPFFWLDRTFDSYPFKVISDELLVKITNEGEVTSWLESDEFRATAEFMRTLYLEGLLNPDLLGVSWEIATQRAASGRFLMAFNRNFHNAPALFGVPEIEITNFNLYPEKPNYRFFSYMNSNNIPISSQNPEAGVKFFDWMYMRPENMQMVLYGVEGEDFIRLDNREFKWTESNFNGESYSIASWMFASMNLMLFDVDMPALSREIEFTYDPTVRNFITSGFLFNPENVQAEFANSLAEVRNSIYPIMYGFVDYETGFPAAIAAVRAAGLDVVLEEYAAQVAAFLGR